MKSVLLHIHDDTGSEGRLQAACDIVRATSGHIHCVQVRSMPDFVGADMYGGASAAPQIMAELREVDEKMRLRVEERLAREGVNWDWVHVESDLVHGLLSAATLADIILVTLPEQPRKHLRDPLNLAADLALAGRTPVLAVPQAAKSLNVAGVALIAWDGSQEASTALRLAVPLLKLAEQVHVVTIEEQRKYAFPSTRACEYLSLHTIPSQLHSEARKEGSVEDALMTAVRALRPDWIVMGAFGHSRMRELAFGGVTRVMLREAQVPLLLAH
ncbi:universal stress protein [Sphingobium bisphenolivorans]|uniref:universal stress protein n=1 Tax=Sphingobium bisphenolivorans TaxID=1335760 RepID=UPI0003A58F89|nr:universal stress protein [Sphingobium bisphenolivorans]